MTPYVYFEDQLKSRAGEDRRLYEHPLDVITADDPGEVAGALDKMRAASAQGYYLAGYFSYELGYCLEPSLQHLLPKDRKTPLIHFGVFSSFSRGSLPASNAIISKPKPVWSARNYKVEFNRVKAYIEAGDIYQANLTFPVIGTVQGSAAGVYQSLKQKQPVEYGGIISLGGPQIISISPELFFQKYGDRVSMRPMKGTAPRHKDTNTDLEIARSLSLDPKNRAENLMIVDLLRNDLSRICRAGSVKVDKLFEIESYPSLHTMTSSLSAQLENEMDLEDILAAMFPCGSVTGAPKIRAMEIINELEPRPRNAYCGAIGLIDPNGDMRFNVAIRTMTITKDGAYSYAVGSGVVYDSQAQDEYDECLLKSAIVQQDFELIETLGWHQQTGFMHVDLHLSRLKASAKQLGFICSVDEVTACLHRAVKGKQGPHRVRVRLTRAGDIDCQAFTFKPVAIESQWTLSLSKVRLDEHNPLLAHKTTLRTVYDGEKARLSKLTGCDEAIFLNTKDEVCEGSFTNIYAKIGGTLLTPPLTAGLLPGIGRQVLLSTGEASEQILTVKDILEADDLFVGNSLRGLIPAKLLDPNPL